MSCYLHHVPGRIRIKVPFIKGKTFLAQGLEEKLKQVYGVRFAKVNSLTGSILAYYDENLTNARAISDVVARETGVDLSKASNTDVYFDAALSKTGQAVGVKIGKAALGFALGQLLEGTPLALFAAVI